MIWPCGPTPPIPLFDMGPPRCRYWRGLGLGVIMVETHFSGSCCVWHRVWKLREKRAINIFGSAQAALMRGKEEAWIHGLCTVNYVRIGCLL